MPQSPELYGGLCTSGEPGTVWEPHLCVLPSHQPQDTVPKAHSVSCEVGKGPTTPDSACVPHVAYKLCA